MEKGHTIPVLNKGYVKLIDWMGTDEGLIEAARMSTGRGFEGWDPGEVCDSCRMRRGADGTDGVCFENKEENDHKWVKIAGDQKLLAFLYANKHSTPFEMAELQIEVQAPIMVFREWMRHRTQSYSERSARYTQMPNLHYVPAPERIQKQSTANKQGSAEAFSPQDAEGIIAAFKQGQETIYSNYEANLALGVAKEVARLNTPISRYSRMRAKTDLRNWLGFLLLRMAPSAQWEIREYAFAVAGIVKALWPRSYALFEEWDLHAVKFSRSEMVALREILKSGGFTASQASQEVVLKKVMG